MQKRTPLSLRLLPKYSKGEEIMNMVTHIVGGGLAIFIFGLCLLKSILSCTPASIIGSIIYGISMISLYTMSSVYHGLRPGTSKKVLQIIDHCTIYFLISGTYTPIMLVLFVPSVPLIGWGILAGEWGLSILAAVLTAIDLRKYRVFSMICYIGMGWAILLFWEHAQMLFVPDGLSLLLSGGIAYTIGAILYGIGSKKPWMHSVFHIFVVLGSFLQFLCIYFYIL